MRILIIGGTGFIGRHIAQQLHDGGHDVTVLHRGKHAAPAGVREIAASRDELAGRRDEIASRAPEVVIDTILSSARQAAETLALAEACGARLVALSSMDAHRAAAVLHGIDPGPPDPVPLDEDAPLRSGPSTYSREALDAARAAFGWIDEDYDKVAVERALPGATILRLPMVYGPGDPLHRLYPIVKRVDDRRPAILLEEGHYRWKPCRGYVENVAAAVVLAAMAEQARGRVYIVGEMEWMAEGEWTERVARIAGFAGRVACIPRESAPKHLVLPYRFEQHWFGDSSRIRAELGYSEPVPADEAIRRTVAWERSSPPGQIDPAQYDYEAEDAALTQAGARQREAG